jgi:putative addiction module killer protein
VEVRVLSWAPNSEEARSQAGFFVSESSIDCLDHRLVHMRGAYLVRSGEMFHIRMRDAVGWLHIAERCGGAHRLARRIERATLSNFGDRRSVSDGVSDIRLDEGAGHRVYYTIRGNQRIILLCSGNKKTPDADIAQAKKMAKEY